MNAPTKRRHRDTLPSLRYLIPSLQTADCSYRHLGFESLEQRVYLASDINLPVFTIIPTATMEIDRNVVIGNPSVETMIRLSDAADVIVARRPDGDNTDFDFDVGRSADNYGYVRITPKPDFSGTIKLLVGVRHAGDPATAAWLDTQTITVNVLPNSAPITTIADFTLTATKPDGSPIGKLRAGEDFVLHVWSQDQRPNPKGIFAAYLNVNWNSELAVTRGEIRNGERFFNGKSGDLSEPGAIKEAGGFGGMGQSNGSRYEVFSVPMRAISPGELSLVTSPTADIHAHAILAHGIDNRIDDTLVQYGQLHLTIGEPSNAEEPDSTEPPPAAPSPTDPVQQTPVTGPAPAMELPSTALVGLELTVTAPDGTPLSNPGVGEDFVLHIWVKDGQQIPTGVLAAFLNISWDPSLAEATGLFRYGERFFNPRASTAILPGLIEEAGAIEGLGKSNGEWLELLSAPLRATADGVLSFVATPATRLPLNEILLNGLDGGIHSSLVHYGQLSLPLGDGRPSAASQPPSSDLPAVSISPIAGTPLIEAIAAAQVGGNFAVSIMELLSVELQAELANSLANKSTGQALISSAALLGSAASRDGVDQLPLRATGLETDSAILTRQPSTESVDDATPDSKITAKTELSLL